MRASVLAQASGQMHLHWATKPLPVLRDGVHLVEDGFLRSHGLGLRLLPPISLVVDDLGIHYDPAGPSRIETQIAAGPPMGGEERASRLIAQILQARLTKYNIGGSSDDLPRGHRILVAGQVEDDASVLAGAIGEVRSNAELLRRAREANPNAVIVWKPHPDVESGYRKGQVPLRMVEKFADVVLSGVSADEALGAVDEVWTLTSLIGFEALLRGKTVTVAGMPFYAGWGLTNDLAGAPARRTARPTISALAHAALIDYPRYWHPVTAAPISAEHAVACLANGISPKRGVVAGLLAIGRGRS